MALHGWSRLVMKRVAPTVPFESKSGVASRMETPVTDFPPGVVHEVVYHAIELFQAQTFN